ncbi:MAG: GAF domain-containing SpoIIE family protein phosphatase [Chloroflexota bacterium]
MTLDVRVLGEAIAVAAAIAAAVGAIRRRSLESAESAAFLAAFALLTFFSVDLPITTFLVVVIGASVLPYLLVRLADHLRPVPRWLRIVLFGGMLYMLALNTIYVAVVFRFEGTVGTLPPPPPAFGLPQMAYLVLGQGYATFAFISGAATASGTRRWRLRLAAAGSILSFGAVVAGTLAVYLRSDPGAPPQFDNPFGASFYALLAAGSLLYLSAFAPPPWLRQMWRLGELQRFLRETATTAVGERGEEALAGLVDAAVRATGADEGAVAREEVLGTSRPTTASVPIETLRAWGKGAAVVGPRVIAVPIQTTERRFGVLTITFRRRPLFAEDDVAVLALMSDSTAIALANDELFREQRVLNERMRALEEGERVRVQGELDRVEQDVRTARDIQLSLLPQHAPEIDGWRLASSYRPARTVGGDFYDFFDLPDGSLAVIVGDASGKGIAAALLMATTRSVLRSSGAQLSSPGAILSAANKILCRAMPPNMFVTCLVVRIEPGTGAMRYANAGHDMAYLRCAAEVQEVRARGMPLGLMDDAVYEEKDGLIGPGELLLLYSDGVVEAHDHQRALFSFDRLRGLVGSLAPARLIAGVLEAVSAFTPPDQEQEDDITLVTVWRDAAPA